MPDLYKYTDKDIEYFLGRRIVDYNLLRNLDLFSDKTILITGAGGSIGKELAIQLAKQNPRKLILIDNSEYNLHRLTYYFGELKKLPNIIFLIADIRNKEKIDFIFSKHRPDFIFNAAALKHVDIVEKNPEEAALINIIGAKNLADASSVINAKAFVQISTDKAVQPKGTMGRTKFITENYVAAMDAKKSNTKFINVRFGNVFGSSGSVVSIFQKQLK